MIGWKNEPSTAISAWSDLAGFTYPLASLSSIRSQIKPEYKKPRRVLKATQSLQ